MSSIVIYSESNDKTDIISSIIAEKIDAKLVEIKKINQNNSFLRKMYNSINNTRPKPDEIKPKQINFEDTDLIIIGSSNHFARISPTILTFINNCDFKNKNVLLFTTSTNNAFPTLKTLKDNVENNNGRILNTFIIKTRNKTDDEIKINTIKVIKELDLDLYS